MSNSSEPFRATDGPWWQHVVSTSAGTFAIYKYEAGIPGGDTRTSGYFKLAKFNGASWTTVYTNSASSGGQVENISIDADSSGNLYVVASTHQGSSWGKSPTLLYRFPAGNYTNPKITRLSIGSSDKITSMYDSAHSTEDVLLMGQASDTPQFFTVDPSTGAVTSEVQLWKGQSSQPNSTVAEYPELTPGPSGEIFAGWFTTDNGILAGIQNYYDAAFIESPDGGSTWYGPGGRLTLPINDTNTGPAYEVVNTNDPIEFLPYTNPRYPTNRGNYNAMNGFAYNNGSLFFMFGGPTPAPHTSYATLAWPGATFANRTDSWRTADGNQFVANEGNFSQNDTPNLTGTLYFTGATPAGGGNDRLIVANTTNGGATWCTYATSTQTYATGNLHYIDPARINNSSGEIQAVFTYVTGSRTAIVYFAQDN